MLEVASLSHGIGAVAFFFLTVILLFHKPTRVQTPWIVAGCFFTAIWATLSTLYVNQLIDGYHWIALSEVLQDGSWCLALSGMMSNPSKEMVRKNSVHRFLKPLFLLGLAGLLINAYLIHQQWLPGRLASSFVQIDFMGHLALSMVGLSLVEKLIRGAGQRQAGVQIFCLSIGALFCYDFFLYVQSLMFSGTDETLWAVRGSLNVLVAPMIALSAFRNATASLTIAPSHTLIFKSTLVLGCGLYLLVMGAVAFAIRELGGQFGIALQIFFIVASVLLLAILVFSNRVRAWIKMMLVRHVFELYYDYREEWLRFSSLLSNPQEDASLSKRMIIAFAKMVESPNGVLFERQQDAYVLKEAWHDNAAPLKMADRSFVAKLDSLEGPSLISNMPYSFFGVVQKAWLLIPMKLENQTHAFIVLGKPLLTETLNWEMIDLIKTASKQAAVFLWEQKLSEELSVAKQFESYHRVSAFMMHDLKNVITSVKLLLQNKKHASNPQFIESIFITLESVASKLTQIKAQLHHPEEKSLQVFDLVTLIKEIASDYQTTGQEVVFENIANFLDLKMKTDRETFKNALKHLIDNGLEASDYQPIQISLEEDEQGVSLSLSDKGHGMSEGFIQNQLFKPFVSTKGEKGMGIGVFQAKTCIEDMGGQLLVSSRLNEGTTFTIQVPFEKIGKRAQTIKEDVL